MIDRKVLRTRIGGTLQDETDERIGGTLQGETDEVKRQTAAAERK